MSLCQDKVNTLEREPWGDGSPLAAQIKGFSVACGGFFFQRASTNKDNLAQSQQL